MHHFLCDSLLAGSSTVIINGRNLIYLVLLQGPDFVGSFYFLFYFF